MKFFDGAVKCIKIRKNINYESILLGQHRQQQLLAETTHR